MKLVIALGTGLIFGLGLIAGGMTDPSKVQGFLDLFGAWDPSLALVMAGAIAVGTIGFALARKRKHAWSGEAMEFPTSRHIDLKLIGGGVLFGAGWGLGGFCPGPAFTALGAGFVPAVWFTLAMLVGMVLYDKGLGPWLTARVAASGRG